MASRLTTTLLLGIAGIAMSCGSSEFKDDSDEFLVGRRPEFYSAAYLWQGGSTNNVVALDKQGRTIQQFSLDPFEHQATLPLVLHYEEQSVVGSIDGRYYVTIGESEYALLKSNGDSVKNPVEFVGKIESVAFDPQNHLLVLTDEFKTMALLSLDADGNFIAGWKAGSLFPGDLTVKSGTMMKDGRLALGVGEKTLAMVDVRESVAQQKWIYSSFDIDAATSIAWLAPVPDSNDILLVLDKTRLLTVNVATKTIIAQKDLSSTTIRGLFRDYDPHIVSQTSAQTTIKEHEITYAAADGQLVTRLLTGNSRYVVQSFLDQRTGSITLAFDSQSSEGRFEDEKNPYRDSEIYRFQLSDNAAVDKTEVLGASLVVTPRFVFLLYKSVLGRAERRNYGKNPDGQLLEGYNFDRIRQRYK